MRSSGSTLLFFAGVITHLLATAHGTTCSNGLAGVQSGEVCCAEECGTCGGVGCSRRPGGADACCITELRDMGRSCSTAGAAPCIVDDEMEEEPETFSYDLDSWYDSGDKSDGMMWCSNGIPGIDSDNGSVCCPLGCGKCGGEGCSRFGPPNLDRYDCCVTEILDYGESCAAIGEAPCYVEGPYDY